MTSDGKRFNACWRYFNPPKRLWDVRLDNYYPKTKDQAAALEACRNYIITDIFNGKGLMLASKNYGTGKSHLSVATVRALMEQDAEQFGVRINDESTIYDPEREEYRGLTCSFFSVVELLDCWRPGSEDKKKHGDWLFHRAKVDDLIVLDDIGAEKASDWTFDRLYAVIDARYRMERATIFTTNCSEKQLADNGYGRIVSRIFEMGETIKAEGPDYRRLRA